MSGQGFVIALTYRIITVVIAAIGFIYYLTSREEVAEILHEVDEVTHAPPTTDNTSLIEPAA